MLYYGGRFVISKLSGIRRYVAKKIMIKNHVKVGKLSVKDIINMFYCLIETYDKVYNLGNGITPESM